jgi:hypothetical protein
MPWSDDDLDEREYPDEDVDDIDDDDDSGGDDYDGDDETLTRECPRCGADVYEDAEQCPLCGTWLTTETSPWKGRAWWWVALAVAGIVAIVVVLALGVL